MLAEKHTKNRCEIRLNWRALKVLVGEKNVKFWNKCMPLSSHRLISNANVLISQSISLVIATNLQTIIIVVIISVLTRSINGVKGSIGSVVLANSVVAKGVQRRMENQSDGKIWSNNLGSELWTRRQITTLRLEQGEDDYLIRV